MKETNTNNTESYEDEMPDSTFLVDESIVNSVRDLYAAEIGSPSVINGMRMFANVEPRTYKLPKHVRYNTKNRIGVFLKKIMILFGLEK